MQQRDDYLRAWESKNVIRYPRTEWMSAFPAPAASYPDVDFIPIEMSVVYTSYLTGRFDLYANINLNVGPQETLRLVVIGAIPADRDATLFCLDTATGRVLMLGVETQTLEPVNASFRSLTEFLYHFALFLDRDTGIDGRAQRASVLRGNLTGIDPSAFASPKSWWSVALAQHEGKAG